MLFVGNAKLEFIPLITFGQGNRLVSLVSRHLSFESGRLINGLRDFYGAKWPQHLSPKTGTVNEIQLNGRTELHT